VRYRSTLLVRPDPFASFEFLADARNSLAFHPRGTEVEQQPPGDIGQGTTFTFRAPGRPVSRTTLTRFERPDFLEFTTAIQDQPASTASWTFTRGGSGTRITIETESSFVGPIWLRPVAGALTVAAWPLLLIKIRLFERRLARLIDGIGTRDVD
jgi:hypothetical protein